MVLKNLAPVRWQALASAIACGVLIMLAAIVPISGFGQGVLTLPLGPPGMALQLALDPLGASFLLLLSGAALAGAVCGQITPLSVAALALTTLAADGFTLALGLLLFGPAVSWRIVIFATVGVIVALAPFGDFAAIRHSPPDGWHSVAMLALVLASATALAAASFVRKREPDTACIAATTISAYLLIRILFDLAGPTHPLWWSVPLLVAGTIVMVAASLRTTLAETLPAALAVASGHQYSVAIVALGVVSAAHSADLPATASIGLAAVWLSLAAYALCGTLLTLTANAVAVAADTGRLDRLGGLIHRMPTTATVCLLGLFGASLLPPGLGFAGFWLLFQSLLAATWAGGFGLQMLIGLIVALTGLSAGLAHLSAVRVLGVAFLGRPRAPRTAVADEAPTHIRITLVALVAFVLLLGLVPALALLPTTAWTDASLHALALPSGAETLGYSPVSVATLLAILAIGAFFALRSRRTRDLRREPAWSGGFAKPPSWLPFGDPSTQYGPVSFIEPLHQMWQHWRDKLRALVKRWGAVLLKRWEAVLR